MSHYINILNRYVNVLAICDNFMLMC